MSVITSRRIGQSLALLASLHVAHASGSSILGLQSQQTSESREYTTSSDIQQLQLSNLSPRINTWFVLQVKSGKNSRSYHLENAAPRTINLSLADTQAPQLQVRRKGETQLCDLSFAELEKARRANQPYTALCNKSVYLRNPARGRRTSIESVTSFLRDNTWGGEEMIGLVKATVMKDAYLEEGESGSAAGSSSRGAANGPKAGIMSERSRAKTIRSNSIGIKTEGSKSGYVPGEWYPSAHLNGIFLSVTKPGAVDKSVKSVGSKLTRNLDGVESGALAYLLAFDLAKFNFGFGLGTDHPRLNWSPRPPAKSRNRRLPGPDGFKSATPLVRNGLISPRYTNRVVAAFTAGFKRRHGAFKWGPMASKNYGSHYGFIESGVVFSKLQPGLATLFVLDNGRTEMRTWREADNAMLPKVRYARQNGVPIVEGRGQGGIPMPGQFVAQWGPGNWSGSAEAKLRTLRAAGCIQQTNRTRYFVYGYFSSATPSAIARVFQAYGCDYGMQLDMNALEHAYIAIHHRDGDKLKVEHLVKGMKSNDKVSRGKVLPRFLAIPDNRDFFFLTARHGSGTGIRTASR